MIRSIGKTCFAFAYKLADARRFVLRQTYGIAPFIVCYHRVVDDFEQSAAGTIPAMLISARMLERQLDWLAKRFALLSLDELGDHLASGRPFERPVAAITFDDGYSDDYQHAYPLLKRKGIPAAFFVVTGLIDSGRPQIFDRLYLLFRLIEKKGMSVRSTVLRALDLTAADPSRMARVSLCDDNPFAVMTAVLNSCSHQEIELTISALEEQVSCDAAAAQDISPLSWDMIETMHRGGMTIGSHTHSHLLLTADTITAAQNELVQSKQILETKLKTAVRHFAYPDGRFNRAVVEAVHDAGYRFGYSICHTRDNNRPLLTIPRKVLWERACLNAFGRFSPAVMNGQVNWAFDFRRRCEHDHSVTEEEIKHAAIC